MWFIGLEIEQETSPPPPKKNPGSAPGMFVSHVSRVPMLCTTPLFIFFLQI